MLRRLWVLFSAPLVATAIAAAEAEPPSAFALLAEVREALSTAADTDESFSVTIDAPDGRRHLFGQLRLGAPPLYRLDLCSRPSCTAPSQTFWRDQEGRVQVRSGGRDTAAPTLGDALLLHLEPDLAASLVIARLRAGDQAALPDPLAATVDGPAACPQASERRCWILSLTGAAEEELHELWVDTESSQVHQLRFERPTVAAVLTPPTNEGGRVVVEVRRRVASVAFVPGPLPAPPSQSAVGVTPSDNSTFHDVLDVRLATVVVRAVAADGTPLAGLGPGDFRLRIGRREVPIAAVDWVPRDGPSLQGLPLAELARQGITLEPGGRLVLFFVQAGLETIRITGHLRMLQQAETLIDGLGVEDRAAVVSFDSHLKLRLDFTRQFEQVVEQLRQAILYGKPPEILPGRYPSLARHADLAEWRRAATPERALELVGEVLQSFSGEKLVVYLGWGLGRYTSSGVQLGQSYERASEALRQANAAVYVLDISDADFHSLESGLRQVAADTGGVYEKTNRFPSQVAGRFARALGGSYVLSFVGPVEGGPIEVELLGKGRILTSSPTTIGGSQAAASRRSSDQ